MAESNIALDLFKGGAVKPPAPAAISSPIKFDDLPGGAATDTNTETPSVDTGKIKFDDAPNEFGVDTSKIVNPLADLSNHLEDQKEKRLNELDENAKEVEQDREDTKGFFRGVADFVGNYTPIGWAYKAGIAARDAVGDFFGIKKDEDANRISENIGEIAYDAYATVKDWVGPLDAPIQGAISAELLAAPKKFFDANNIEVQESSWNQTSAGTARSIFNELGNDFMALNNKIGELSDEAVLKNMSQEQIDAQVDKINQQKTEFEAKLGKKLKKKDGSSLSSEEFIALYTVANKAMADVSGEYSDSISVYSGSIEGLTKDQYIKKGQIEEINEDNILKLATDVYDKTLTGSIAQNIKNDDYRAVAKISGQRISAVTEKIRSIVSPATEAEKFLENYKDDLVKAGKYDEYKQKIELLKQKGLGYGEKIAERTAMQDLGFRNGASSEADARAFANKKFQEKYGQSLAEIVNEESRLGADNIDSFAIIKRDANDIVGGMLKDLGRDNWYKSAVRFVSSGWNQTVNPLFRSLESTYLGRLVSNTAEGALSGARIGGRIGAAFGGVGAAPGGLIGGVAGAIAGFTGTLLGQEASAAGDTLDLIEFESFQNLTYTDDYNWFEKLNNTYADMDDNVKGAFLQLAPGRGKLIKAGATALKVGNAVQATRVANFLNKSGIGGLAKLSGKKALNATNVNAFLGRMSPRVADMLYETTVKNWLISGAIDGGIPETYSDTDVKLDIGTELAIGIFSGIRGLKQFGYLGLNKKTYGTDLDMFERQEKKSRVKLDVLDILDTDAVIGDYLRKTGKSPTVDEISYFRKLAVEGKNSLVGLIDSVNTGKITKGEMDAILKNSYLQATANGFVKDAVNLNPKASSLMDQLQSAVFGKNIDQANRVRDELFALLPEEQKVHLQKLYSQSQDNTLSFEDVLASNIIQKTDEGFEISFGGFKSKVNIEDLTKKKQEVQTASVKTQTAITFDVKKRTEYGEEKIEELQKGINQLNETHPVRTAVEKAGGVATLFDDVDGKKVLNATGELAFGYIDSLEDVVINKYNADIIGKEGIREIEEMQKNVYQTIDNYSRVKGTVNDISEMKSNNAYKNMYSVIRDSLPEDLFC